FSLSGEGTGSGMGTLLISKITEDYKSFRPNGAHILRISFAKGFNRYTVVEQERMRSLSDQL
ncbi:hypothetical protein MKX03_026307, partial [Papaver bracteatum]